MKTLACLVCALVAGGCAASMETVSNKEWNTVPAADRAQLDRAAAAEQTKAEADLRAASLGLAQAQHAQQAQHHLAATGDYAAARTRIDGATTAWLGARVAYYQARVAAANLRFEVVRMQREEERAYAVNQFAEDEFPVGEFRGQAARAQERWYAATQRADQLQAQLQRASADISAAKSEYARLVTGGTNVPDPMSFGLQLTSFEAPRIEHHLPAASQHLALR